jgi:hypothetical protein
LLEAKRAESVKAETTVDEDEAKWATLNIALVIDVK